MANEFKVKHGIKFPDNTIQTTASTGGGGSSVSVGTTPPGSPSAGALWWNSETGTMFIWYNDGTSSQWVDTDAGGPTGPQGETGPAGPTGPQGNKAGLRYNFSTTTTDSDPGTGTFRFNNAIIASVTQIYIDVLDQGSVDFTTFIDSWDDSTSTIKGHIYIASNSNSDTTFAVFELTAITTATGYRKLSVNYESGTLPSDAEACTISFIKAGDIGAQGPAVDAVLSTKVTVYTSGTGTFTADANALFTQVICTGGGGGGGGSDASSTSNVGCGGGGAAGGTAIRWYTPAEMGATATYSVGTAGSGGNNSGTDGTAGGNSSFDPAGTGTTLTATGGGFGIGSGVNATTTLIEAGGAGGVPTGGQVNITGGDGTYGMADSAVGDWSFGGNGGASYWGGGGEGGAITASGSTAGAASTTTGAGGGGGATLDSTTGATGGAGAEGIVYIVEYLK